MARDTSKPTEVRIFAPPHCKDVEIAYTVNITLSTMKLTDPIKFQTVRLTVSLIRDHRQREIVILSENQRYKIDRINILLDALKFDLK
jgi:hypothetical protein